MGALLGLIGLGGVGRTGFLVIGLVAALAFAGGSWTAWHVRGVFADWKSSRDAIHTARVIDDLNAKLRKAENERLTKAENRKAEVRYVRIRVPKLVTPDRCRFTDDGLRELEARARAAFAGAKRKGDAAMPAAR